MMAASVENEHNANFLDRFQNRPLTIVAVGKTGAGKSSTLNSILKVIEQSDQGFKPDYFTSSDGPNSCTNDVSCCEFTPPGLPKCKIVDTIGLFDTKLTQEDKEKLNFKKISYIDEEHRQVLEQFLKVMATCNGEIDAFLFVFKAMDRATKEQLDTINIIFRYLGWNILNFVVFVITGKDESSRQALEGWKDYICNVLNDKGYQNEFVKDRFIFVDNKNPTRGQAKALLNLVRYVSEVNRGKPYTDVAFKTAQRELEKEKQEIKAKLDQEFNTKMEAQVKLIEARFEIELTNFQERMAKTETECAQLKKDQILEKQKLQEALSNLKMEQEEEKLRFKQELEILSDQLERKKQEARDRAFSEYISAIKDLAVLFCSPGAN